MQRLLEVVEDRDTSAAAFEMLKKSLAARAQVFPEHLIGWQGGSRPHTVYWLPHLNFWAVLEQAPPDNKKGPRHRFWNCFGTEEPARRSMLSIVVEINPPHEGENRRLGGLFACDGEGRMYIAHTGKVGGGRKGIGQKAFRDFSKDLPWQEIGSRNGPREVIVLGPIDANEFQGQVSDFIHKVADFKLSVVPS